MRGCLSTIITILIVLGFGTTGFVFLEGGILLLLEPKVDSFADVHWYTWLLMLIVPLLLLKLLIKVSRITANYICDLFGLD